MKILIVYYSQSGNTAYTAQRIAEKTGAELLEIVPEKSYPEKGAKKFLWGGKSALMKETPALKPYAFDASGFDAVVLGYPVWASTFAPPVRTFAAVHKDALKGKKIAAFACYAGSGAEKSLEKLKAFLEIGSFAASLALIDPKDRPDERNEEKIDEFCRLLQN